MCVNFNWNECRLQREVEAKRQEVQEVLVTNASKMSKVLDTVQELKAFEEQKLSELFKGRQVHISGDFNRQ